MEKLCRKRMVNVGILLTLAILSLTGVLRTFQEKVILPSANSYVEESQEKALTAFVTISIVKGIVAVIEGSDVVGIEVGDLVQPLYDAIDITWRIITLSLASLYVIEVLLDLCAILGQFTTTLLLILLLAYQFVKKETIKKSAYFTGMAAAAFFIGIPLTLYISGEFSKSFSEPTRQEFDTRMDEFQLQYESRLDLLREGDLITFEGSITSPRITFPKYYIVQAILTDLQELIKTLPDLLLRTGVTWLLDVIIVPLGLLFILYRLAILYTQSAFNDAKAEKLDSTLKKYLDMKKRQTEE